MYGYNGTADASNMNAGLNYHIASSIASRVKICLMTSSGHLGTTGNSTSQINDLVSKFQNPNYMMSQGRPLLYVFVTTQDITNLWGGSNSNFAACLSALRIATVAAGMQTPFIVTMAPDSANMATYGEDAVSQYTGAIPTVDGGTYQTLASAVQAGWTTQLTAPSIVPICMTGWDPRPRNQHPEDFATIEPNWFIAATLSELTTHLKAARTYIDNSGRCPARTALAYHWSEFDEGGPGPAPSVGDPAGTLSQAFGLAKH